METEERIAELERHIENQNRQNRRMKWVVGVLGIALVVGIGWRSGMLSPNPAQGQNQRVVEAEEFRLVDESGELRAMLKLVEGKPVLDFYDEKGVLRAVLGMVVEGLPGLGLYDENGKIRVGLGVGEAGPSIGIYDENEHTRNALYMQKDGQHLVLVDENGAVRAFLSVTQDGPSLGLRDATGKTLWSAP